MVDRPILPDHLQFMQFITVVGCLEDLFADNMQKESYFPLDSLRVFSALPSCKKPFASLSHRLTNELIEYHRDLTKLGSLQEMMQGVIAER